jgi:hypothetical protein
MGGFHRRGAILQAPLGFQIGLNSASNSFDLSFRVIRGNDKSEERTRSTFTSAAVTHPRPFLL